MAIGVGLLIGFAIAMILIFSPNNSQERNKG